MPIDSDKQILRLQKQHTPTRKIDVESGDGARLVRAQSVRQAIFGGLIAVILFSILWVMLSTLVDRVFPWLTIALGLLIGLVMRRAGQGLDWRFPLLAAVMTVIGALVGNVVVAAAFTAQEFETGTLQILRAVTTMTWPVFFAEVISVADVIYALFGAAIAAFYAKRRLTRAEYLALRIWQQEQGR
ncbi:MAG: hypothetical protein OEN22_03140 [Gammaproteobacteria bacterium]|nr:hypothetical protein [Gammaproteobacteria bacterium]